MPDGPVVDIRDLQWKELQAALGYVTSAEFEYGRGNEEAGAMWLGDVRRSLGVLALLISDAPDVIGYAKLLGHVLTDPQVGGVRRAQP